MCCSRVSARADRGAAPRLCRHALVRPRPLPAMPSIDAVRPQPKPGTPGRRGADARGVRRYIADPEHASVSAAPVLDCVARSCAGRSRIRKRCAGSDGAAAVQGVRGRTGRADQPLARDSRLQERHATLTGSVRSARPARAVTLCSRDLALCSEGGRIHRCTRRNAERGSDPYRGFRSGTERDGTAGVRVPDSLAWLGAGGCI